MLVSIRGRSLGPLDCEFGYLSILGYLTIVHHRKLVCSDVLVIDMK